MKRSELLKNEGYWTAKIQIDLYEHLEKYMDKTGLNRSQLAKKLGVSKGYISQIFNGEFNHRISKLVELSLAIDKIPEIVYRDLNEVINQYEEGIITKTFEVQIMKSSAGDNFITNQSQSIDQIADNDFVEPSEKDVAC